MPRVKTIQNSFTSGELDPLLKGRTDLKNYFSACEKARNVLLIPQGGAKRRHGLDYVYTLPTVVADGSLSESRCLPFVFSTSQTYKIVACDLKLLIFNGKTLVATVTSPYGTADLAKLNWVQAFDSMFLFHEDFAPYTLKRGGAHSSWTMTLATITSIPRYQFTPASSNPAATLTPSAVTGTVTLTASAGVFTSAHVGQYIEGNGARARILSYVDATHVQAYLVTPFYDVSTITWSNWTLETGYEDAWSATRGWPRCGSFHQGRLFIGGSRDLPMTLWGSHINDYWDFSLGTSLDDEGIDVTLQSDDVASINQVFSGRHLQIFTSSGEFFVPTDVNSAITPNTITLIRTTQFGSKDNLRVMNVDGATLFINRTGGMVREFLYDNINQAYNAESLSLLASHLIRSPVDVAFRKSTSTDDADYMLLVNNDGTLAMLNTLRTQNVTGWSLMETQGSFKSVGVELDTMFFVVEHTINGVTNRYIEYFDANNVLDSSVRITTGLPTSTFTGLDHLNGETVHVVADGNVLADVTVSGGSATIERDATTYVEFGRSYKASGNDYQVKTMPVERELPDGTMIGKKKRLVEVTALLDSTKSVKINGVRVPFRSLGGSLLDVATTPYTGQKVVEGLLGFADEIAVDVGDDVPLDATINAVAYKVAV